MIITTGQKKINWVSVLKGIGILVVVWGHMATPLTPFIFSWHIPFFVFISGFFIKEDNFLNNFKKDAKRLLLPFIVFSLFPLVIIEPLKRLLFPDYPFILRNINYWEEIKGILLWMDINHLHHYGFVLWFLPALFWARSFLFGLKKVIKIDVLIFLITIVGYLIVVNKQWILPFGIDKALLFMPWIFLGNIFFRKFKDSSYLKYFLPISIILICFKIPEINLGLKLVSNSVYGFIYSIVLILACVYVSKLLTTLKISNVFKIMGENSMLLLIIHPYVNNASYILTQAIHLSWIFELLVSVILLFVIIMVKVYVKKTKYANLANWI